MRHTVHWPSRGLGASLSHHIHLAPTHWHLEQVHHTRGKFSGTPTQVMIDVLSVDHINHTGGAGGCASVSLGTKRVCRMETVMQHASMTAYTGMSMPVSTAPA